MAHFALVENGTVQQTIVISNDDCGGGNFPDSEPIGQAFIASLGLKGEWLQTSYSGSFRNMFAGPGILFEENVGPYGEFVSAVVMPPVEQ
jgi:hypothetical protein